jgi:hypothetical protein
MRIRLAAQGRCVLPHRFIDSTELDPAQAERLARAVKAALAESAGRAAEARRELPDARSYTVTIEDGGEPTMLRGGDGDLPPEFARLLGEMLRALRR